MKSFKLLLYFFLISQSAFSQNQDSIFNNFKSQINTISNYDLKLEKMFQAGDFFLSKDLDKSYKFYDQVNSILKKNDKFNKARLNIKLALYYINLGAYTNASKKTIKALSIFERLKDTNGIVNSLLTFGKINRFNNNDVQSLNFNRRAVSLAAIINDSLLLGESYNLLGVSYRRTNNLDSALISYRKAAKIFYAIKNKENLIIVQNNLATYYSVIKQFDKSLPIKLQNLEYSKSVSNRAAISVGYYNISVDYLKTNRLDLALKYIDSSLILSRKMGYKFRVSKAAKIKSTILSKQNNFKEALKYSNLYHVLQDSLFSIEKEKQLKEFELNRKFDLERKELEFITKEQESKIQSYLFILIVTLVFGFITAYYVRRNFKGKNKYLATKLEREKLKKELLNERIKVSETELKWVVADNSMRVSYLNQFLESLKDDANDESLSNNRAYIKVLQLKLQQQITTERKLSAIQNKIEEINKGFEEKLIGLFPNLTKSEREVCALLRVNLTIKEMASIRNSSVDSIKSIRYRLRKKMLIPKGLDIESFVKTL